MIIINNNDNNSIPPYIELLQTPCREIFSKTLLNVCTFSPTGWSYLKHLYFLFNRLVLSNSMFSLQSLSQDLNYTAAEPIEVKASISLLQRFQRLLFARLLPSDHDSSASSQPASING